MRAVFAAVVLCCLLAVVHGGMIEKWRRDLCGKMIHREYKGAIPSHPRHGKTLYPRKYKCVWRIQAPPLNRIRVLIPDMSIEFDHHCGFDHLDIYDDVNTRNATKRMARLCGKERDEYISSGAYMTLSWTSDKSVTKSGFLVRYSFVPANSVPKGLRTIKRTGTRCASGVVCSDGFCVPKDFICDGFGDCSDKRDEKNCPGATSPPVTIPATTTAAANTEATKPPTEAPATHNPTSRTTTTAAASKPPTQRNCGTPKILPDEDETRVVGGKVSISGSWPWTVSLRLNGGHTCGGSIIAPRWILTAAHCVEGYTDSSQWTIVAGLHKETDTGAKTQTVKVQRIIVHPQWNSQATDYDYTLLYLTRSLTYTNRISPICLPSKGLGGAVGCYVAGWGATKGTGGAGFLKQAFVKTFTHTECNGFYGGITNRMICAGHREGGRDTCQGDSGGPLMCKVAGKWELHGATSFGGVCAAPNSPGVYARISTVLTWVRTRTGL